MITCKMKSNMSDLVFLNRLIVFILLMSGGSTFSQIVEEKIPSPGEMTINNNRSVGWQACAQMREARISPAAAVVFDVPSDEDTVAGICTPL